MTQEMRSDQLLFDLDSRVEWPSRTLTFLGTGSDVPESTWTQAEMTFTSADHDFYFAAAGRGRWAQERVLAGWVINHLPEPAFQDLVVELGNIITYYARSPEPSLPLPSSGRPLRPPVRIGGAAGSE